jgi:hypothetical protein
MAGRGDSLRSTSLLACLRSFLSDSSFIDFIVDITSFLHPKPDEVLPAVMKYLCQHLGNNFNAPNLSGSFAMPDLRCLPSSVHLALTNILAETLQQHAPDTMLSDSPTWVKGAVVILLSPSRSSLADLPLRILRNYLCDKPTESSRSDIHDCPSIEEALSPYIIECRGFTPLSQHFLAASTHAEENMVPCVRGVLGVYRALLEKTSGLEYTAPRERDHWHLSHFLFSNLSLFENPFARPILDDLWEYVREFVDWNNRFESSPSKPMLFMEIQGIDDAFRLLTLFSNHDHDPGRWGSLTGLLIHTGTIWSNSLTFFVSLAAIQPYQRLWQLEGKSVLDMAIGGHEQGLNPLTILRQSRLRC